MNGRHYLYGNEVDIMTEKEPTELEYGEDEQQAVRLYLESIAGVLAAHDMRVGKNLENLCNRNEEERE